MEECEIKPAMARFQVRRSVSKILLFVLLIAPTLISSGQVFPRPTFALPQSSDIPLLNVGDTWNYHYSGPEGNSKEQIVRSENCGPLRCLVDQETNQAWNDTAWLSRGWDFLRDFYIDHTTSSNFSTTYTPPLHLYRFPLAVGESWWWNVTFAGWYTDQLGNHTQPGPYNFSVKRLVVNETTVTVPAGTFETFLVAQYRNNGTTLSAYRWFSLEAKTSVKWEALTSTGALSDSYEMTSYTVTTPRPILSITSVSPSPARPQETVRLDFTATEAVGDVTATWVDWGDGSIPDLLYNMTSESMCPSPGPYSNNCAIARGAVVLAQRQDPSTIVNGSIIIFRPLPDHVEYLVMHRIVRIIPPSTTNTEYSFWTRGDANVGLDAWDFTGGISSTQVLGVYKSTLTISPTFSGARYDTHAYPSQGNTLSRTYTIQVNATDDYGLTSQKSTTQTVAQNSSPSPTAPGPTILGLDPRLFYGIVTAVVIALTAVAALTLRARRKTRQTTSWESVPGSS